MTQGHHITTWRVEMNKLLFAMLVASPLVALPNSGKASPVDMAPGFTNSVVERRGGDDRQPRQEGRRRDRRQERRQDRREDREEDDRLWWPSPTRLDGSRWSANRSADPCSRRRN